MEISFPTDSDGFLSQECPSCDQQFKVLLGEGSDQPVGYCPHCGHHGQECWFTTAQVEHIHVVTRSQIVGPALKNLQRSLGGKSSGNNFPQTPPPLEHDSDLPIVKFPCCNETVKLELHDKVFCIICGKEINVQMSDAKKVFLSHKGVDKTIVNDFKDTLKMLGFDPWIDEDAMPAGTTLERGLLQGMADSCGVVFFLTPSFKDEGYLETEVNYAIQQKRKKGDKFAIISLQFVDDDGNSGEIPELLKTYVWKKPNTKLEAIREILRALPIECGAPDWRTGIDDVLQNVKTKSTTAELSDEAKAILTAASKADGIIMHLKHLSGQALQIGGQQMLPSAESRVVALWAGGLEDLQRRRFIVDCGHKREIFKLTREGYQAADELQAE